MAVELQIKRLPVIKWELPDDSKKERAVRESLLLWDAKEQINIIIDGKLDSTVDREVIYS